MDEKGKIDCIVLAAGFSTRMGSQKLLMPLGGATMVETTVGCALAAGLRVILVTRPGAEAVEALFAGEDAVAVVRNEHPERGMLSSIREGVRRVTADRLFFIPADMPFVSPATYRLIAAFPAVGPVIPVHKGRKGHPVLMPANLASAILHLPPDGMLKTLIATNGPTYVEVEDEGILRDIDTREEYEAAVGRKKQ